MKNEIKGELNVAEEHIFSANPEEQDDFLFGCFLGYKDALYLCRSLDGLIRLNRAFQTKGPIDQRITDYASSCIRTIFPQIKIPGWTTQEFEDLTRNEEENKNLSHEELMEKLDEESKILEEKIDSGEIDIWDDTPKYVSIEECKTFLNDCINILKEKGLPACNEKVSLIEGLSKKIINTISEGENNQLQKDYQALLALWDSARMHHEGEPPFKVVFASQVIEKLGIDPIMEEIRTSGIRPVRQGSYESKKLKASLQRCLASSEFSPTTKKISEMLFKKIVFKGVA
jgi:hypothetical protein